MRTMRWIAGICAICAMLCLLPSCGEADVAPVLEYQVEAVAEPSLCDFPAPFTRDQSNYFFFRIGTVRKVPVFCGALLYHKGTDAKPTQMENGADISMLSEGVPASVAEALQVALVRSVETEEHRWSTAFDASENGFVVGVPKRADSPNTEVVRKALAEALPNAGEVSVSYEETVLRDTALRERQWGKSDPKGYYRYTVYQTVAIYAVVIENENEDAPRVAYCAVPDGAPVAEWVYAKRLEEYNVAQKRESSRISFSYDRSMGAPEITTGEPEIAPPEQITSCTRKFSNRVTVTDDGVFGLKQESKADTLSLSELAWAMNDQHTLRFTVELTVNQPLLSMVGTCEIYLYNRRSQSADDSVTLDTAMSEYGLVAGHDFENKDKKISITWAISGELCAKAMYIYYDARGEGEDTWYREAMTVTVEVLPAVDGETKQS